MAAFPKSSRTGSAAGKGHGMLGLRGARKRPSVGGRVGSCVVGWEGYSTARARATGKGRRWAASCVSRLIPVGGISATGMNGAVASSATVTTA